MTVCCCCSRCCESGRPLPPGVSHDGGPREFNYCFLTTGLLLLTLFLALLLLPITFTQMELKTSASDAAGYMTDKNTGGEAVEAYFHTLQNYVDSMLSSRNMTRVDLDHEEVELRHRVERLETLGASFIKAIVPDFGEMSLTEQKRIVRKLFAVFIDTTPRRTGLAGHDKRPAWPTTST